MKTKTKRQVNRKRKTAIKPTQFKYGAFTAVLIFVLGFGSAAAAQNWERLNWQSGFQLLDASEDAQSLSNLYTSTKQVAYDLFDVSEQLVDTGNWLYGSATRTRLPRLSEFGGQVGNRLASSVKKSYIAADRPYAPPSPITINVLTFPDIKDFLVQAGDHVTRITYHSPEPKVAGLSADLSAKALATAEVSTKAEEAVENPRNAEFNSASQGRDPESSSGLRKEDPNRITTPAPLRRDVGGNGAGKIIREINPEPETSSRYGAGNYTLKASLTEQELTQLVTNNSQLLTLLKGDKGDKGEQGPVGPQGAPGTGGITYVTSGQNPGSVGGITYFGSKDLRTETLTVTSDINQTGGNATLNTLTVTNGTTTTGNQTISGNLTVNGNTTLGDNASDTITLTGTVLGASPLVLEGATANDFETTIAITDPTADRTITIPNATGTLTLTTNDLSVFAATTSAQLAGVISDETGSGLLVFATSPTLTTPVLGVATATTINKVTITAPATAATLTIVDGKTLTASNTLTFTGTDSSSVAFGGGGTATYTANNLSVFAATTSAQLAGVISDETGSGALVFGTSPTITTSLSQDGDVADAGYLRLQNAALIAWEASPAGVDVTLTVDASEIMQASGTFNATTLTEGAVGVPNVNDNLSVFAATTSAQLAGVSSDETGSGLLVFATSPTLTTPTLGVATATTINKVTITAPATAATLTIAEGKTLTASNTLTFTGTDASSVAFGGGGTVAYTANNLSVFAATTSAQLAGVISDETGSGALVLATSPTLTTPTLGAASATSVTTSGQGALQLGPFGAAAGNTGESRFLELAANGVNYVGFKAPDAITANVIWTLPSADATSSGQALTSNASGVLSWTSAGVTDATFVTLSTHTGLSAERVLTGTTNQITITDAGANGNVTLSTPQDIATSSTPQFGRLGLGTAADATTLLLIDRADTSSNSELITFQSAATTQTITGAVTNARFNQFMTNTITAGTAQTVTTAATLYIEGATTAAGAGPASITNNYALFIDAGLVRMDRDGIGATATDGLQLMNNTDAAAGAQQYSPALRFRGEGWKTDATAASQNVDFRIYTVPVQGAANPTSYLSFDSSVNDAAFANRFTITSAGNVGIGTTTPRNNDIGLTISDTSTDQNIAFLELVGGVDGSSQDLADINFIMPSNTGAADTRVASIFVVPDGATANNRGAHMRFYTKANAGSLTERIRILSGGNVGIGTATPSSTLHISNASNATTVVPALAINTNDFEALINVGGGSQIGPGAGTGASRFLAFQEADVAHSITTNWRSTSWFNIDIISGTGGGSSLAGLSDEVGVIGMQIWGVIGVADPTDTVPAVKIIGAKKSGADTGDLAAAETVFMVTNNVTNVFKILGDGAATLKGALTQNGAPDIAENVIVTDQSIEAGDVVSIDSNYTPDANASVYDKAAVKKAQANSVAIGVVSSDPGIILNAPEDSIDTGERSASNERPITLAGRVPVKVTEENGAIVPGDRLTVSKTLPGYAMKMTESGQSIGIALEESNEGTDKILVFVNLGYQKLDVAAASCFPSSVTDVTSSPAGGEGNNESSCQKLVYDKDIDMSGMSLLNVKAIASMNGKWSISEDGTLVAQKIRAKYLELEDEDSGQIYCVKVKSGELLHEAGECGQTQQVSGGEDDGQVAGESIESPTAEGGVAPEAGETEVPQADSSAGNDTAQEPVSEPTPAPESESSEATEEPPAEAIETPEAAG